MRVETSPWHAPSSPVLLATIQVILQGPVRFSLVTITRASTVSQTLCSARRIQKDAQDMGPAFRELPAMVEMSKFSDISLN